MQNILLENSLPQKCNGITLYTDFRNMIRFELALYDDELDTQQKAVIGLMQLFNTLPNNEKELKQLTDILVWFYSCGRGGDMQYKSAHNGCYLVDAQNKTEQNNKKTHQSENQSKQFERAYDFTQDAMCIYASFLQAYAVDLTSPNYLHWWKFCAMLENLPQTTPLAQRMAYRVTDTSTIKDKAQKQYYESLKKLYALKQHANLSKLKSVQDITLQNLNRVQKRFDAAKSAINKQ